MASMNFKNFPLMDIKSEISGPYYFSQSNPISPKTVSGGALLEIHPDFNFSSDDFIIPNMEPGALLDLQSKIGMDATQELSVDVFDYGEPLNNNKQHVPGAAAQALSKIYGVNENMLQWSNDNFARVHFNSMRIPEEQLTVNVDAGEGSMHSWRPNQTDSLTSDVFVAQPGLDNAYRSKREQPPQLFLWDSPIGEESVSSKTDVEHRDSSSDCRTNYPRIDVQSHIQTQKTQLNGLKYEVINAKHKLNETQDAVAKLSCELEEKLLFKNSKEMKLLRDENAELRLECQCLCSEVDYYLSGTAPLGEIDESFWEKLAGDDQTDNSSSAQPQTTAEHQKYDSEEQEEANKWECPLCTFANHPAISSCEMCHVERVRKETAQLHSSDVCFCHPKQDPHCS